MLLNSKIGLAKLTLISITMSFIFGSNVTMARELNCQDQNTTFLKKICSTSYDEARQKLLTQSLTAYLITDAPIQLLADTHQMWYQRLQQCKSHNCIMQQLDKRTDQLNFLTSMNQSMTQHYLKYESGRLSIPAVHLQIHQLSKDNIKIEGTAYRNPNNRTETQTLPFLAYSTVQEKQSITNNENDCTYDFKYEKAILKVSTENPACSRFSGIYRLYD